MSKMHCFKFVNMFNRILIVIKVFFNLFVIVVVVKKLIVYKNLN